MEETAAGKLTEPELNCLLDHLRNYIESDMAVILTRAGVPDSCGNPVYLDGAAFLSGFAGFLKEKGLNAENQICALCLVMELSGYVRRGGTKALAYRLETGSSKITPDYFDALADSLCWQLIGGEFQPGRQPADAFLFQRLKEINLVDESLVAKALGEIDDILLALSRKLEEASLAALEKEEIARRAPSL